MEKTGLSPPVKWAPVRRNFLKYLNFGLVLLLVIRTGIVYFRRQRKQRLRLMQERHD